MRSNSIRSSLVGALVEVLLESAGVAENRPESTVRAGLKSQLERESLIKQNYLSEN